MRAVIQRVVSARVCVEGQEAGAIGPGLLVLLGIADHDDMRAVTYLANKIIGLRVFDDEEGRFDRSVQDTGGAVLLVSQFTLFGDCRRGRRPSFDTAAKPERAERLYEAVADAIRASGVPVETGVFQTHMAVESVNDGPVTLLVDSTKVF